MESTIRLFKGVMIPEHGRESLDPDIVARTIRNGYILSKEVMACHPGLDRLVSTVNAEIGLSPEALNASFHKSWAKVRDASIEQLVVEQMLHYLATYGFESLGVYDESTVYFPNEALEIPEIDAKGFRFVVINGYTKGELKEKLLRLLRSGIALGEKTLQDAVNVAMLVNLDGDEIESVKNKEVKIMLYDLTGKVPGPPVELLRYIVFKATESTLLIKSPGAIEKIKERQNLDVVNLMEKYKATHGLERLATIFHRFKPLFLAFRTNVALRRLVNKIRKLATKHHKPMPSDYLNDVTRMVKDGTINHDTLRKALKGANVFRKIRLAYALKYRTTDADSMLYRVRNGKSWATSFSFHEKEAARQAYWVVKESIVADIRESVHGKAVCIPDGIAYALPATEKQFTGDFPSGTSVHVPSDMIFGVHWKDLAAKRVDLDLSLVALDSKIGWDAGYRNEGRTILFSGDVTSAPGDGATELFYVKRQEHGAHLLVVNYYNHDEDEADEVPFKIVVASERAGNLSKNYMLDPNSVLAMAKTSINKKQKLLGLVTTSPAGSRFCFAEAYMRSSITSASNEHTENTRKYLVNFYGNMMSLNEILALAGAKIVGHPAECDIDLSPEGLDKGKIIDLIQSTKQEAP